MNIKYTLSANDFLAFQLFTASHSPRIQRNKNRSWILLTVVSMLVGAYFLVNGAIGMAVYFFAVSLLSGLFFPKYFIWRHKRHYSRYVNEVYANRFDDEVDVRIESDYVYLNDKTGESKLKTSEVERVDETATHFFLQISSGLSLIIPKRAVENPEVLKECLNGFGVHIFKHISLKWS